MDLNDTFLQVDGPSVHFTHKNKRRNKARISECASAAQRRNSEYGNIRIFHPFSSYSTYDFDALSITSLFVCIEYEYPAKQ
jgi:hypothetical protein